MDDATVLAMYNKCAAEAKSRQPGNTLMNDLIQEMICYYLERGVPGADPRLLYLRALDRLDPRHSHKNIIQRRSQMTVGDIPHETRNRERRRRQAGKQRHAASVELAQTPDWDIWIDLATVRVPKRRTMLILWSLYGLTMQALAQLYGMTEGRVQQILTGRFSYDR